MRKNHIYKFAKDVRNLYCQLRISELEDTFIKLAQTYEESLVGWLKKKLDIKLSDQGVLKALRSLSSIKEQYPAAISYPEVVSLLTDTNHSRSLPYFMAFYDLLGKEDIEGLLAPFQNIIMAIAPLVGKMSGEPMPVDIVYSDLRLIQDAFLQYREKDEGSTWGKKPTVKVQKKQMFIDLLRMFSDQVSQAANNAGETDLASRVSQGALANPGQLSGYANLNFDGFMGANIKKLVNEIVKRYDSSALTGNFEGIKANAFKFVQLVSPQQKTDYLREKEDARQRDLQLMMDPDTNIQDVNLPTSQEMPTISVDDAKWIDPQVLGMISATFLVYHSKLFPESY